MYKIWKNYGIISFFMIIIEVIFRLLSKNSIWTYGFIRSVILINIIGMILSIIVSILPKILTKIINILIIVASIFYAFFELAYYNYMGVYASLSVSSQAEAVKDYIKEFIESFHLSYYLLLIPLVLLIFYYIVIDKRLNKKNINKKSKILLNYVLYFVILIGFVSLLILSLNLKVMQNKYQQISNKILIKSVSVPTTSVNEFGIITFGILDVKNYFIPFKEKIVTNLNNNYNNLNNNDIIVDKNYERLIDDATWNEVIKHETNNNYKTLNNYFINQKITNKNEYTGYFEDKNLIVIMMESVNLIIDNEEFFPNYAKMLNNSWYFSNNYSPRNSCSTGNNELSTLTGLYSIYNSCTSNIYKNNTYYNSMFNLFNNKGYTTTSMHDFTEGYYRRSVIHKNLGVNEYYGVQKLGIPYSSLYGVWASDEEFIPAALSILDSKGTKKMTFLTTVSTHQPYTVSSKYGDLYYDLFANTEYSSTVKRYLSKLKVFDNALGLLLDGLKTRGELDNTVIVMYGDHYPYGINKKLLNTILDFDNYEDYEAERTPLLIYNSLLEKKTFTQYTSFINILPTISNLFNLEYDPRLYMGTDLLSNDYQSIVVFADGSWKNEKAFFDAKNSKVIYYGNDTYTDDEIYQINNSIKNKMTMSSLAIKTNYFNRLKTMLDKYQVVKSSE